MYKPWKGHLEGVPQPYPLGTYYLWLLTIYLLNEMIIQVTPTKPKVATSEFCSSLHASPSARCRARNNFTALKSASWERDTWIHRFPKTFCLVVEPTHLKNMIVKNGNLPKIGVKIKNIWNHHLAFWVFARMLRYLPVDSNKPCPLKGMVKVQKWPFHSEGWTWVTS